MSALKTNSSRYNRKGEVWIIIVKHVLSAMYKSDYHIQETQISVRNTSKQNCALDIYQGRQGQNSQNLFWRALEFSGLHQALTVWYQVAQSICPGFFLASKGKHPTPLTPVPPDHGSRISMCYGWNNLVLLSFSSCSEAQEISLGIPKHIIYVFYFLYLPLLYPPLHHHFCTRAMSQIITGNNFLHWAQSCYIHS